MSSDQSRSTIRVPINMRLTRRNVVASLAAASALAATSLPVPVRASQATPASQAAVAGSEITEERLADALAALPELARTMLGSSGVPGLAAGVVHQDEVVFLEGYGVREAGLDGAVDADTVFQIASLSKPIASTVVASLVGQGHLTWDAKLADLYPEFALSDPLVTATATVADLFSHRSGLPDHAGDTLEDLGGDRETVLHALRYLELPGAFRASYAYTNFGLTAGAVAAAMAAGGEWEDLSVTQLYQPLGMTRTSSRYADFASTENRAVGHVIQGDEWVHAFDRQPDAQSPAGGVSSSVRDICQWLRLQLGQGTIDGTELIPAVALAETHLPYSIRDIPDDPTTERAEFYGLGWNVTYGAGDAVQLSHSGAFAYGAATTAYLLPSSQLGIVVLTNGAPVGLPEALALSFLDLCRYGSVQRDYLTLIGQSLAVELAPTYGHDVATPPDRVDPPKAPQTYLGTYDNAFFGELEVVEDGEHLAMVLGPQAMQFPLAHYSRDVFTYEPVGENAGPPSSVTFTVGADQAATAVTIENLDEYGSGTFTRPPGLED
jgi:CubicO group peptidase (beta-lactamase class C family)